MTKELPVRQYRGDERLLDAAVWDEELGAYEWDLETDSVRWLNDWCRHYDIDPCVGSAHGVRWRERVHPEDRVRARYEYDLHVVGLRDRYESEYRILTLGGRWRWIRNRGHVVKQGPGARHRRLMGICVDVDERKRLEAALDRSRRSLEALATTAPIWMMLTDADGIIEFINRPLRHLKLDPAGLCGRPMTVVASDSGEAARIESLQREVVSSAQPQTHTMLLNDGSAMAVWANPILEAGKVTGIAVVIGDVSERRNRERDLLGAVTAEQRRFAHDLHDGLGQELTGIALLLKTLVLRAGKEAPALARPLEKVLDYTNTAIATSREVARGVSPVGREYGGLTQALQDLVARLGHQADTRITCRVAVADSPDLDPLLAENLYRIAQEALANALRHSGARQITVRLERSPASIRLAIEDDGLGFLAGANNCGGLGLRIMRSRAELVGAQLSISALAPQGTRVECVCEWA